MNLDKGVEREPARWELAIGSQRDARDLKSLDNQFRRSRWGEKDTDLAPSTASSAEEGINIGSLIYPSTNALILRRGNKPLGYMAWSIVHGRNSEIAIRIDKLYISKAARSAGTTIKFIHALQAEAEKAGAKKLRWEPKSGVMHSLSRKIGAKRKSLVLREIPVEKLNPENLFENA